MQFLVIAIKRAFWVIFLCLVLISFPQPSFAVTVQNIPNPQKQDIRGWVTDMANLLDSDTEFKLNQMISKLEHQNGTEITVVTVPDTMSAATPKEFATQLFKYWGIGKKGINNGVLFLISKSDRQVEIDTGYGIEKILPNARITEIIDQQVIPRFTHDDFSYGTVAGVKALVIALEEPDEVNIAAFVLIGLAIVGLSAIIYFILRSNAFKAFIMAMVVADDSGDCGDGGGWGGSDSSGFGGGDSDGGGDGGW